MSEPREGKFKGQEGAAPEGRYVIPQAVMAWVVDYGKKSDAAPDIAEYKKLREEFDRRTKENPEYELALYRLEHPDWIQYEDMGPHEYDLLQRQQWIEKQRMEEKAERTPVNPENNILTHYEETLDRMAKIEGEVWKRVTMKEETYRSVAGALKLLREAGESAGDIHIYGESGWNRWVARKDGSVEFSAGHATLRPDDIWKAKGLGFKVHGEVKR